MKSKAFTLIELLTVIAIIGILAAILIPVVGKVRESARAAVCNSNIRQVSIAMIMFADDDNGILPTTGSTAQGEQPTDWIYWRRNEDELRLSPVVSYLGNAFTPEIYRCPSDQRVGDATNRPNYAYSFTMNRALDRDNPGRGDPSIRGRIEQIREPTRIILLVEEDTPNDSSAWLENPADELTQRHGGHGHVSFVDGHVRLVTPRFARHVTHWDPLYEGPLVYRP